jgi:hypothetical protein
MVNNMDDLIEAIADILNENDLFLREIYRIGIQFNLDVTRLLLENCNE